MKIRRLYIGDMGIYRNALMENISCQIVVIGGLNRSGKTTFLEVLRNMPYGFPKNLRPSSVEYYLECDLENENSEKLSLRINGLKEPQISFKNESRNYTEKLYGDIDKFTYSQLCTISLDELKKLNNKSEEEKLQAVLLGAGINDIVHIPKLIENIRKDKEKIGGKNGSPAIKLFKPYYEDILSGVKHREEALEQVEVFTSREAEEHKINQDILLKESEIDVLKNQILVFELLDNNYDDYIACNKLKNELEVLNEKNFDFDLSNLPLIDIVEALYEEYCEVYNSYNKVLDNENVINKDENECIELLKFEDKIKYYVKNISGLKQKLIEHAALKKDFEVINESIQEKMDNINNSHSEDYTQILNIDCHLINEDRLVKLTEDMRYINDQKLQCNEQLEDEKEQIETLKKELKSLKNNEIGGPIKSYLFISFGILCVSILVYFVSRALAAGLFITGITTAALYYFIKQGNVNQINSNIINLKLQLKAAENKQAVYIQKFEKIHIKEADLNKNYYFYKEKLMIEEDITMQGLLQYFKEIKELKHNIVSLKNIKEKVDKNTYNLNIELKEMYTLASKFVKTFEHKEDNALAYSEEIFHVFEILDKELEKAKLQINAKDKLLNIKTKLLEKLRLCEYNKPIDILVPKLIEQYKVFNTINGLTSKLQTIEKNIIKNLSSERIGNAFKITGKLYDIDKYETLEYFYSMLCIYPVKIEIQKEIELLENKLKESNSKLEELKEKLQIIKLELNSLATSGKLQEAQRLIDEGRLNLKPLAVKYSVLSAAEYILETVQKDFLDDAKHKL